MFFKMPAERVIITDTVAFSNNATYIKDYAAVFSHSSAPWLALIGIIIKIMDFLFCDNPGHCTCALYFSL